MYCSHMLICKDILRNVFNPSEYIKFNQTLLSYMLTNVSSFCFNRKRLHGVGRGKGKICWIIIRGGGEIDSHMNRDSVFDRFTQVSKI